MTWETAQARLVCGYCDCGGIIRAELTDLYFIVFAAMTKEPYLGALMANIDRLNMAPAVTVFRLVIA